MWNQIIATAIAFLIAIFGFAYNFRDSKLQVRIWDHSRRRPVFPGWPFIIAVVLALGVAITSGLIAVEEASSKAKLAFENKRMEERIKSVIRDPTVVLYAEFDEASLRVANLSQQRREKLNGYIAKVNADLKMSPPTENDFRCYVVEVDRGSGSFELFENAETGSFSALDFLAEMGFLNRDKKLEQEDKLGFKAFDLSMSFIPRNDGVNLYYHPSQKKFFLQIAQKATHFHPQNISSMSELPGSIAILRNKNTNNAYLNGVVAFIGIRDESTGREYVIPFREFTQTLPTKVGHRGPGKPLLRRVSPCAKKRSEIHGRIEWNSWANSQSLGQSRIKADMRPQIEPSH